MKSRIEKRDEAMGRQEIHDKLSLQQRLIKLDRKFGVGEGATKERNKLETQLEKITKQGEKK